MNPLNLIKLYRWLKMRILKCGIETSDKIEKSAQESEDE